MTLRRAALAVALAATPALSVADGWAGAALGGGWDSNVNLGIAGAPAISAGFASARAYAGLSSTVGDERELAAEVRYEGTFFPEYSNLDLHRPSLALAWSTGESSRLRLEGFAGWLAAADSARGGWDAGGSVSLRHELGAHAALRAAGGYLRRVTTDPAYATSAWNARAGAEARVLGATLWGAYQAELGTVTVTRTASGGGTAGRRDYGVALDSSLVTAVVHGPAVGAWVPLGRGFALSATWRWSRVVGDAVAATRQVASVELGWGG